MTGIKTYKEKDTEKTRGKKRFLERVVEEKEADQEIEQFKEEHPNRTDELFPEPEEDH
jgi:hypothetical protein